MSKKLVLEKQVEYKKGQIDTWYMIKMQTEDETGFVSTQIIDLCKDNETKAYELLDKAVNSWVPESRTIIKEIIIT
jgi:hypothetical protein